ncbi:caspase family protein [Magnetofaba australis]|nr:caspase family protein [Magnetofaba australis]
MTPLRRSLGAFARSLALPLALTLWSSAACAQEPERGLRVTPLPASAMASDSGPLYSDSQALVIGVNRYNRSSWPNLTNAVADAREVAAALRRVGFHARLLANPDLAQLESALKRFFIEHGDDPEARLLIWFSGHGHSEQNEGFLIPADAPSPEAGAQFRFNTLSLRRFGELMRLAKAKHILAVFDACFAGSVFESARSAQPPAISRATGLPVRQFLTSGDAGQSVSDDGLFRRLFVDALRGQRQADFNQDGFLTGSELGMFLSDRISNYTHNSQTPRYGKLRDPDFDRGDFVFQLAARKPEAPSASQSNLAAAASQPAPPPLVDGVWREPRTGIPFVWIPGDCEPAASAKPCAPGFWLSQFEITNAQFRLFDAQHDSGAFEGLTLNTPQQPVVRVSHAQAQAFAQWLSADAPARFVLPSAQQWRRAAHQFDAANGADCTATNLLDQSARKHFSRFPWLFAPCADGYVISAPAMDAANATPRHLRGNVFEWIAEPSPANKSQYLGGSWRTPRPSARDDLLFRADAQHSADDLGFRLAATHLPGATHD